MVRDDAGGQAAAERIFEAGFCGVLRSEGCVLRAPWGFYRSAHVFLGNIFFANSARFEMESNRMFEQIVWRGQDCGHKGRRDRVLVRLWATGLQRFGAGLALSVALSQQKSDHKTHMNGDLPAWMGWPQLPVQTQSKKKWLPDGGFS